MTITFQLSNMALSFISLSRHFAELLAWTMLE